MKKIKIDRRYTPVGDILGDGPLPHTESLRTSLFIKIVKTRGFFAGVREPVTKDDGKTVTNRVVAVGVLQFLFALPFLLLVLLAYAVKHVAQLPIRLFVRDSKQQRKQLNAIQSVFYACMQGLFKGFFIACDVVSYPLTALCVIVPFVEIAHGISRLIAWSARRKVESMIIPDERMRDPETGKMSATVGSVMKAVGGYKSLKNVDLLGDVVRYEENPSQLVVFRPGHADGDSVVPHNKQNHSSFFALAKLNPMVAQMMEDEGVLKRAPARMA